MAKLRTNHRKRRGGESGGMIIRSFVFFAIVVGFYLLFKNSISVSGTSKVVSPDIEDLEAVSLDSIFFLPSTNLGEIIKYKYYALSYVEELELPEWVAFELSTSRLQHKKVKRTNDYRPDPYIESGSSNSDDFFGSGFDRGHLAAAADMAFSEMAMSESFYMSNMAPQNPAFNKGIWRELEELGRDWARQNGHLYVITGPIFRENEMRFIGNNNVGVPDFFYKIFLDLEEPEIKGIGFIIPNELSRTKLAQYATSIDAIEAITQLDFFHNLIPDELELMIESKFDLSKWEMDEEKYLKRINKWNLN